MQVAILHYAVPPIIGGVEVTIAAHARLLRERGYDVTLVAGRGDDAVLIPEIDSRHPRVEAVQRELNQGRIPADFESLTRDLIAALEQSLDEIDIVIAHNVVTLHKNLALTAALHQLVQSKRIRLLAWCHDLAWADPVYSADVHNGEPWDLMRRVWENTRYIVVSEARRQELARLLQLEKDAIAVVPPGLDAAEFFRVSPTTARWLNELKLLEGAPLLLLPARVTRRKNIELAIDIISALGDRGFAPKLVVMGPLGPHNPANRAYLDELKQRAQVPALLFREAPPCSNTWQSGTASPREISPPPRSDAADRSVIFLQEHGAVGDEERRDLYALADALLFPSAREGFGIPILEAGLAQVPIFCADIPTFRESALDMAHYFGLDESPPQIAARLADFFQHDARYLLKRRTVHTYNWDAIINERIVPLLREYRDN